VRGKASSIKVLLVDDQVLFLNGLANVLSDWPEVKVVGEAANGAEGVARARELRPDVIFMDLNMPVMDGVEATRAIVAEMPETKIVMLTVSEEDASLHEALKAGACGYLIKDIKPAVLHEMLLAVARGETPISPLMAGKILRNLGGRLPQSDVPHPRGQLTDREREVLELVAMGADNATVAQRLVLAPGTVKRHLHNIFDKLQAKSRAEAAAFARYHGMISPKP
jgi:DNA-binding NarL/FixJ family response regulator